jgi:Purine catabolism regulatory protein-like family/PucR C-terminal helix-turn-helix domain
MLALRDLIRDLDVKLVAGEEGLERPVRWVHISELADPTPWLSGGELLLTTGMNLTDAASQRAFVERLANHELAGLGLGVGFAHKDAPKALIEAATEYGFPLFEVPYDLPFIAITEKAFSHLVNEQYAVLQRALSAHERLERIVLSEQGLEGVTGALASLIGGTAMVFDTRGESLARSNGADALTDEVLAATGAEVRERARAGARRGYAPSGELHGRSLALPVVQRPAGGNGDGPAPQAWLVAVKDRGGLGEFDRLVLHQAVTVVALELLRRRVADDTERRLAGDVLSAMVSGELAGSELARRLEPFGLHDRVGVLVLTPPRSVKAVVEDGMSAALRDEVPGGLAAGTGRFSCALLPLGRGEDDDDLFALAERVRARVSKDAGMVLAAGAGRAVAPADLRRTFHEARCALEARALSADSEGNGAAAGPPLATYRDLGSFQLLLALQDDDALRLFCDSILAPIEQGEGAYGGELMRSLEAFIECNGQWERAARQLYCHRHTLRYRIRRVEELTGRSLDSARDRIDFWLALRGRELVT